MITTLDRYIGRYVIAASLLALGVFAALFVFAVLVDALPDYGRANFGFYQLARYVLLSQPRRLYELFPVVALIGTLLGLSVLARGSELVAMRAAGVSATRIGVAALKAGTLLIVAAVAIGELVVPWAETEAQSGRARALATGLQTRGSGLWLRDGAAFLNVGEVLPGQRLLRATLYDFEEAPGDVAADRRLRAWLSARSAQLVDGNWRFEDAQTIFFEDGRLRQEQAREVVRPSRLTPQVLDAYSVRPEGLSAINLYRYVHHLERHGQDSVRYRLAWWQKLLLPLAMVVMILFATPFVLRPERSGGLGHRVFLGVMWGLAFILAGRSFGYFGLLYGMPPLAGAVAPLLLFLGLALFLLWRAR
jgi:lipopolysaccharide export system permease protein